MGRSRGSPLWLANQRRKKGDIRRAYEPNGVWQLGHGVYVNDSGPEIDGSWTYITVVCQYIVFPTTYKKLLVGLTKVPNPLICLVDGGECIRAVYKLQWITPNHPHTFTPF